MSTYPNEKECIRILKEAGCKPKIIIHCKTVKAVAEAIANVIECDKDLVIAGALLHDLGRSRDHSILHAYVGYSIALELGLPQELAEIIKRHIGAGLDDAEVKEYGLPHGDYVPKTIEQKIVAHADNMVSGDLVVSHTFTMQKLSDKGSSRGAKRIKDLHLELSKKYGEDLDNVIDVVGICPCANDNLFD